MSEVPGSREPKSCSSGNFNVWLDARLVPWVPFAPLWHAHIARQATPTTARALTFGSKLAVTRSSTDVRRLRQRRQDFRRHVAAERAFRVVDEPHVEHFRRAPVAAARRARAALVIAVGGRVVCEGDDRSGRAVQLQIVVLVAPAARTTYLRTSH